MTNAVKSELDVVLKVKQYLLTKDIYKEGLTICTDGEGKNLNEKVILINTLFSIQGKNNQLDGYLNINLKDQDPLWIEYISELTQLYLDYAVIDNYIIEFSNQHLFKVTSSLFFKNLKFKFTTL